MAKVPRKTRATLDSKFESAALEASRRSEELKEAEAKLAPLRKLVAKARAQRDKFYAQILHREGASVGVPMVKRRGRRPGSGKKRAYTATPESKVAATIKRQTTRAINAGKSEAEAKKIGHAAGKALAEKLGVKQNNFTMGAAPLHRADSVSFNHLAIKMIMNF